MNSKTFDPVVCYQEGHLLTKFQLLRAVDSLLSDSEDDLIIVSNSAYKVLCNFEDEMLNEIVDLIEEIHKKKYQSTL